MFKVFLIVSWLFPGLQRTLNVPWDPRSVRRGDRGWCSVTDPGSWNLWGWKSSLRAPGPAVPQHCRVPECHNKLRWPCSPLLAGHTLPGITAPVTSSELLEQSWFPFSKHSCLKHQSHRVSPLLCLLDNSGSPRLGTSPGSTGGPTLLLGGHQSIRGSVSPMR